MGLFPKQRDLTKPLEEVELMVDASFLRLRAEEVHMRLDQFLALHLTGRSRSSIQALIKGEYVLVEAPKPGAEAGSAKAEVETRPGRKLGHGTRVVVVIPEELRTNVTPSASSEVEVLYEDDEVIAVDKPAGLVVHPSGRYLGDTLIQRIHARYQSEIEAGKMAPRLCHRLDKDTSGIVLIGKRSASHAKVTQQFEDREVTKEYLAIIKYEPDEELGRIEFGLAASRTSRIGLKMAVAADGLPSRTDWEVVTHYRGYTLVKCRLYTGRQHQIRVHLSAIGHPIIGDKLYGPDDVYFERALEDQLTPEDLQVLELPRQALHNHRLVFVTPAGGKTIDVVSPLAPDLRAFLDGKERLG